MKANKYCYLNVIQQHFGHGWEDVSEYEADSQGRSINDSLHSGKFVTSKRSGRTKEISLLVHDVNEYRLTGYPTRIIFRKELKEQHDTARHYDMLDNK